MKQNREQRLERMRAYRATPESKAKRIEYDRKRLQNPEVITRMKAYRLSEKGKEVSRKSAKKYRGTEKHKEYRKVYRNTQKAKDVRRNQLLLKIFGITLEKYNEMLSKQNGVCAICLEHKEDGKRSLAVDHCHKTGKVRGLLCRFCNQALGQLGDKTETLKRAINYLQNV